jgi:hypothetical protein
VQSSPIPVDEAADFLLKKLNESSLNFEFNAIFFTKFRSAAAFSYDLQEQTGPKKTA